MAYGCGESLLYFNLPGNHNSGLLAIYTLNRELRSWRDIHFTYDLDISVSKREWVSDIFFLRYVKDGLERWLGG